LHLRNIGGAWVGVSMLFASGVASAAPPAWVGGSDDTNGLVCAIGIAGRAHALGRYNAAELAAERAFRNLAGVFETVVREAEIDRATEDGTEIEYQRALTVDEELIERVTDAAGLDLWIDAKGEGPFEERGFSYARACVSAKSAVAKDFDPTRLVKAANAARLINDAPPEWLGWIGSEKGARLCAVGFSLPALHPEATFENVVEDVRAQLVERAKTLIMSLSEELTVCKGQSTVSCKTAIEVMTAAATEATSRGVLVDHFWYDRNGAGPAGKPRTTYGWGCTHPVGALTAAVSATKKALPEVEPPSEDRVRARAAAMFEELEREEAKIAARP
jgi:hypothetical protein